MKVTQLYPSLYDPMDYRVHGILQARILKWVVIPLSKGSSQPRDQTQASHIAGLLPAEPSGKPFYPLICIICAFYYTNSLKEHIHNLKIYALYIRDNYSKKFKDSNKSSKDFETIATNVIVFNNQVVSRVTSILTILEFYMLFHKNLEMFYWDRTMKFRV